MKELVIEMSNGKTIILNSIIQKQIYDLSLFYNIDTEEMKLIREAVKKFLDKKQDSKKVILKFKEGKPIQE